MRFAPPAAALTLAFALTASVVQSQDHPPDPRAAMLVAQGEAALSNGEPQLATDAFEAALAIDPAYTEAYVRLAEAAREEGLQGKAITYYRAILTRHPRSVVAISGEGAALAEKGALEKARRNLAKLQSLCGAECAETRQLVQAIAAGARTPALAAETNTDSPAAN